MAGPFDKVTPGREIDLSATAWNSFIDAAIATRAGTTIVARNTSTPSVRQLDGSWILVKNDSGATVNRFGILSVSSPIINPGAFTPGADGEAERGFVQQVAVVGQTPSSDDDGNIIIMLDPTADGEIGRGMVAGVSVAALDIVSESHRFADIKIGSTDELESGDSGSAVILWKATGTGSKWGLVKLGSGSASGTAVKLFAVTGHGTAIKSLSLDIGDTGSSPSVPIAWPYSAKEVVLNSTNGETQDVTGGVTLDETGASGPKLLNAYEFNRVVTNVYGINVDSAAIPEGILPLPLGCSNGSYTHNCDQVVKAIPGVDHTGAAIYICETPNSFDGPCS